MSLGIPQILLALGAGVGERRERISTTYREEKKRQQAYWDANGAAVKNQMDQNANLSTQAIERLQAAGLSEANAIQLLEVNGVESAIMLDKRVQDMRNANDGSYEALVESGKINEIITFNADYESDSESFKTVIDKNFGFADLKPIDREQGTGFLGMITDRIKGRDLEDEHNKFMDDDFIGDISIRELKEARGRAPIRGSEPVYDASRLSPYDLSPNARAVAKIRRDNLLAKGLKTYSGNDMSQQYQYITSSDSGYRTTDEQIDILLSGNTELNINKEDFIDILREADSSDPLSAADATVFGLTFIELQDLLRPAFDRALESEIENGDIPELQDMDPTSIKRFATIEEYKKYVTENPTFNEPVYIEDKRDFMAPLGSTTIELPVTETPAADPTNLVPDATKVVKMPFPTEGENTEKQEWNKKYFKRRDRTGLYDRDTGIAIVVPRRPTTEAEQAILIASFDFDEYKGSALTGSRNRKAPTLEQTQTEWDEKYAKSHDPSGYPLGFTLVETE